jgi:hypothetical protein
MTRIFRAEQAKQGRSGHRILLILLASLALVMIVWAGVELYGNMIDDSTSQLTETERNPPPAVELDQPESAR